MAVQVTTDGFRDLLAQSGLVGKRTVGDLISADALAKETPQELADLLVSRDVLTQWQADKLLQGKHRGFFLGEYQLQSHLARGGMSTLYVARHKRTGELRALKILPPAKAGHSSYLPRFLREARLASELEHPNIMRVFELRKNKERSTTLYFMVMELLQGRDLYAEVSTRGPLPVRLAADVIRQSALGLENAHLSNLVHRDVKPGNLFLTDAGVVKVLDLGLAGILQDPTNENLTRVFNERVLGTADYLAPEQAVDSHAADARADIYGLGCTFYFVLTGRPPFPDGNLAQRILAHQTRNPKDVREIRSDVPDAILELLRRMLIKHRGQRIQTAQQVADELGNWLQKHIGDSIFDQPAVLVENDDEEGKRLRRIRVSRRMDTRETPTDQIRGVESPTSPDPRVPPGIPAGVPVSDHGLSEKLRTSQTNLPTTDAPTAPRENQRAELSDVVADATAESAADSARFPGAADGDSAVCSIEEEEASRSTVAAQEPDTAKSGFVPEFAGFLKQLDTASGISAVIREDVRAEQRRVLSCLEFVAEQYLPERRNLTSRSWSFAMIRSACGLTAVVLTTLLLIAAAVTGLAHWVPILWSLLFRHH